MTNSSLLHEEDISFLWWEEYEERLDQVEVSDNVAELTSEHQWLLYFLKHYYPQILKLDKKAAQEFRGLAFNPVDDSSAVRDALELCLETNFALPDEYLEVIRRYHYDPYEFAPFDELKALNIQEV